jgi:DNA-binding transcriptional MocR family regulator
LAAIENTQACAADTWLASDAMPARSLSATNPVATTPSPRDGQGLAQGICDQLQQMIYGGEIAAGERLNEAALALSMGTSRGPIREAIRMLTGIGLVEAVPSPSATSCRWPPAAAATWSAAPSPSAGARCWARPSWSTTRRRRWHHRLPGHRAAAPDGYTLMQGYVATHGTSPATRKLPYDAIKDFTPVGMIGATPNVLVVNAKLPVPT